MHVMISGALLSLVLVDARSDERFTVEEVATPPWTLRQIEAAAATGGDDLRGDGPEARVALASIVNIGKSIWSVVDRNKPSVDAPTSFANALPKGISNAIELSQFSPPMTRSFRVRGENLLGISVYDVTYTIVHQFGGTYRGKGRYLATVGVIASAVDVSWGYKIDLGVERAMPVNVGSEADPVAGLTLELSLRIRSPLQSKRRSALYAFRGDVGTVSEQAGFAD